MKFQFSDHSKYRFVQRFSHLEIPIENAIKCAIPFGGQIGSQYLLLNTEHNIVFAVVINHETSEHWVKTTLTHEQAMANMSRFCKFFSSNDDIKQKVEKNREEAAQFKDDKPQEVIVPDFIQKIAMELIQGLNFQFPNFKEQRQHEKKMKETFKITNKQFKEMFWPEVGKIVHEYHNKCGRFG